MVETQRKSIFYYANWFLLWKGQKGSKKPVW